MKLVCDEYGVCRIGSNNMVFLRNVWEAFHAGLLFNAETDDIVITLIFMEANR